MLDALHAATAINRGISAIVTADTVFEDVPQLRRLAPSEAIDLISDED